MGKHLDHDVRIRCAEAVDAQAVFALQNELFPGDVNQLYPEDFSALSKNKQVIVLVAELAGDVVGFLVLRNRPARPWTGIDFVGVAPHATGRGIGRRMVEVAIAISPRPILRLFVRPSNTAARALYARLGFRHSATRKASYADGDDALVQMKWVGLRPFRFNPAILQGPEPK